MAYFDAPRADTVSSLSLLAREGLVDRLGEALDRDGGREGWRAVDNKGWTALHHAAAAGQAECVALLGEVGEGALTDTRTWEGETPLLLACKELPATKSAVHALLKLRADPNLVTNESCSPLHWAALQGQVEVVKWLVRRGARVNHSSVWGETALHHCLKKCRAASPEARLAILRYLLRHGARPVVVDENQLTPLMLTAQHGFLTCLETLLAEGGDYGRGAAMANLRAEDGATALHMAAQAGRLDCAAALLGCGADASLAANDGTLALHLACIARDQSAALLDLLLPVTAGSQLEAACRRLPLQPLPRLPEQRKELNPFQLCVDWENYSSLEVLVKHLEPRKFLTRLEGCYLHKDRCPWAGQDGGQCQDFPPSSLCPLGLLLQDPLSQESVSLLPLLTLLSPCLPSPPSTVPPLLALLTSPWADPRQHTFLPSLPAGSALTWLSSQEGVAVAAPCLLPLLLQATVSGLYSAVRLGLLAPHSLTAPHLLQSVRQLSSRQADLQEQVLGRTLLAQRLLCTAILATHAGHLSSDWVQNLALLVLDEFRTVLNIRQVVVVDRMYQALRTPQSLQRLARAAITSRLQQPPKVALVRLEVPGPIRDYLLYSDLDVEVMVQEYRDTMDHVSQQGTPNVLVV